MNLTKFDSARNALVEEAFVLLPGDIEGRLTEIEHWLALIDEADSQIDEGIRLARRGMASKESYLAGLKQVIVDSRKELEKRRREMDEAAKVVLGYEHVPERPEPRVVVPINPNWHGAA